MKLTYTRAEPWARIHEYHSRCAVAKGSNEAADTLQSAGCTCVPLWMWPLQSPVRIAASRLQ